MRSTTGAGAANDIDAGVAWLATGAGVMYSGKIDATCPQIFVLPPRTVAREDATSASRQSVPWTADFPDFPSSSRVPEPDPRASSRHPVDCSKTCRERHKDKVFTLKVTLLFNDLEPNGLSQNGLRQFFLVQSLLAKDARLVSDKLLFLPAPCRSASRCSLTGRCMRGSSRVVIGPSPGYPHVWSKQAGQALPRLVAHNHPERYSQNNQCVSCVPGPGSLHECAS